MRITLLGATGPTGAQLLGQAQARNIEVTVLVRDPNKLAAIDPGVTVVVGDATNSDDLAASLLGSDAVVSALGSGRSRRSDVASKAAAALVTAARHTGVDRVIWLSALGVGESRADGSGLQRMLWKSMMSQIFADKAIGDQVIAQSGLRYTLVYPTTLSNKPNAGGYTAARHVKGGLKAISRSAVAEFMLNQLVGDEWVNATAELVA